MKGIVIGGMALLLVFGCNNRVAELENENKFLTSISNLGKGFLSIFTDLGDMVSDAFGIKAETKKEAIGTYFSKIATTMKSVKEQLNAIMAENGNYAKVKEKVDGFIKTIETIEEGAKKAAGGASGSDAIGNAVQNENAKPADKEAVNALVRGIKEIVGVVLKQNEGDAGATKTEDAEKQSIGKLFGQGSSSNGDQDHAAVKQEDMSAEISESGAAKK